MRRLVWLTVLPVLLMPALWSAAPVQAKGPTEVMVSGPGIDDVVLTTTRRSGDVDAWTLAESSSLFQIWGAAQVSDRPALTRDELGPRYVLTWYAGGSVMVRTHAYPFAKGGAWANVPHEMRSWVRGGPDLRRAMVRLGAMRPDATTAAATSGASTSDAPLPGTPERSSPARPEPAYAGYAAGAAGLALLAAAGAWLVRRRRTPQPF